MLSSFWHKNFIEYYFDQKVNLSLDHLNLSRRQCIVVNLDPAAEHFNYEAQVDIRELISIEDVMEDEDLRLGPNGGLVFCMEHLVENLEWFHEALDPHDDDYFLIGKPNF